MLEVFRGEPDCGLVVVEMMGAAEELFFCFPRLPDEEEGAVDFFNAFTRVAPFDVMNTSPTSVGSIVGHVFIFEVDRTSGGVSVSCPGGNFGSERLCIANFSFELNRRRIGVTKAWRILTKLFFMVFGWIAERNVVVDSSIGYVIN